MWYSRLRLSGLVRLPLEKVEGGKQDDPVQGRAEELPDSPGWFCGISRLSGLEELPQVVIFPTSEWGFTREGAERRMRYARISRFKEWNPAQRPGGSPGQWVTQELARSQCGPSQPSQECKTSEEVRSYRQTKGPPLNEEDLPEPIS